MNSIFDMSGSGALSPWWLQGGGPLTYRPSLDWFVFGDQGGGMMPPDAQMAPPPAPTAPNVNLPPPVMPPMMPPVMPPVPDSGRPIHPPSVPPFPTKGLPPLVTMPPPPPPPPIVGLLGDAIYKQQMGQGGGSGAGKSDGGSSGGGSNRGGGGRFGSGF